MKFNFRGIKFSTWLYFLGFSIAMLSLLGFLLVVLIKPYYREDRIKTVDTISDTIEKLLLNKSVSESDIENTARIVVGNNVCTIIYNENNSEVYYSDSLGQLCMLDSSITIGEETFVIRNDPEKFIDKIKEGSPYTLSINSSITGTEMVLYGKQIKTNLANYYLVINTPLEPVESYINFIMNQYLYIAVFVIIIALIVSFFLAQRISNPIVKMKNEANKLAEGDYDVKFEANSFSEINDLANTLDDATNKLSQINDLRKDLLANVSHDIKTPLTMIRAYAEMIKDISGDNPTKRNEHLDVILMETEYLNKLVTDMSELSKLQSGIIELNRDNFDLKDCTNRVIDLLKKIIVEKKIDLVTNLDDCVIYADEIKISQVVYNFLSNAIKHSSDEGKIIINIIKSEDNVRLEVIDFGEGISQEALPYIWDRYYKVDKNFNRNVNSTGLGLAIAKAILEAHKANYGVESKLGEGSKFYFELSNDYDDEE